MSVQNINWERHDRVLEKYRQGNLPCVHDANDGCNSHNPARRSIHFDASLLHSPVKPSGNQLPHNPPAAYTIPEIWSHLPHTPECLATLPSVHKSVPWSLSFYHVNALLYSPATHTSNLFAALSCVATTGTNPSLSWTVTPLVYRTADGGANSQALLVRYSLAFAVEANLGSWSDSPSHHGRAIAKQTFIGKKMREAKEEWRSENDDDDDGLQIKPLFCERCYTDTYLRFQLIGATTLVGVQVYKNQAQGLHPAMDPVWLSVRADSEFDISFTKMPQTVFKI
ncbi:hypothetical protein B0H63DRAFT_491120 [Podospora didyma]|uniref:Uncharacterized protein n=1 Tax=Podospora didyma TaxID=330526 RepID=A0AAE0P3W5_9PEZI|nr:hypothetical protein B0H63DRAFT_491120 [Podospora didyma]